MFQLILNNLSSLFLATNHKEDRQRTACAEAYGSCATRHLTLVLDKLENLLVSFSNCKTHKNLLPSKLRRITRPRLAIRKIFDIRPLFGVE